MIDYYTRNKSASYVLLLGTGINTLLFGVKLWIGLVANNISIFSDAVNNLGDVISCFLSFICFLLLKKKRTEKFPHGYGRLEYISSLIMSLIIVFIGGYFVFASLNRLMLASPVTFKWTHFLILVGTIVVKILLAIFYRFKNKKIHSDVLRCAFFDSIADAAITTMTVIGLLLNKFIQLRLDGFFGIVVSIVMISEGIKLFLDNIKMLIGPSLDESIKTDIINKLQSSNLFDNIEILDYFEYGLDEKKVYIKVEKKEEFTKEPFNDIINKVIQDIYLSYGINVQFLQGV